MSTGYRTQADLVKQVALALNLIPAHVEPSVSDGQHIASVWEETHADGIDDEYMYWDVDDIPLPVFRACVNLVAARCAAHFGIPADGMKDNAQTAIDRMRRHKATTHTNEVPEGEWF
jgi:hypothetical protein